MAKVVLVNPPFYRLLGSHYNANSLGIAYICSYLNKHDHDAWLYNADHLSGDLYKNTDHIFNSFNQYTSYFENKNHEIWEEVATKIIEANPEWVGYTSYTANIKAIDIISELVKIKSPKIKQVVGGVHSTLDPDILLHLPNIDYAVRREGEVAMLDLVNGIAPNQIQGVVCRNNPFLILGEKLQDTLPIEDIDSLPMPERDRFLYVSDEDKSKIDVSYICSVRGCPYRCSYCASPFHWKRNQTRYRSAFSVIEEMKLLKQNYWNKKEYDFSASANSKQKTDLIIKDNTIVYFVDDIFTIKKQRAIDIMNGILDENLLMPWKCEVRADHLDEELCKKMKEAGCVRVKIGFESGSDRILKQIQKDETKSDMLKGVALLKEAGIAFTAYFMAGFPNETDDDLRETIKFAKEIEADYYSLSILSPYYGTKMYFDLVSEGFALDKEPWEYFFHQTGKFIVNSTISTPVLQEYLSLNNLNNNYV